MRRMIIAAMMAVLSGMAPPEPIRVGQVAPPVVALTPGGDHDIQGYYKDRLVLLTFWSLDDEAGARLFEQLKKIRQGMADEDRLLILSVCTDDPETHRDAWLRSLEACGRVAYGDRDRSGPFRFREDHKWLNAIQDDSHFVSSRAYGVGRLPEAFLIGPDRRLVAVRIPVNDLGTVVAGALSKAR